MKAKKYFRFSGPVKKPPPALWEASMISVKTNGKWIVFIDKDKKPLNQPFINKGSNKKYYKHVTPEIQTQKYIPYDSVPLNTEVSENYDAFFPRRELIATYQEPLRTRTYDDDYGTRVERRGFTGKPPLTAPIRMSTKILNEKRKKDIVAQMKPPRTSNAIRSPRRLHKTNTGSIKPFTAPTY